MLDPFGGGSTLIAAEKHRRTCRTMELDPQYCDRTEAAPIARTPHTNLAADKVHDWQPINHNGMSVRISDFRSDAAFLYSVYASSGI